MCRISQIPFLSLSSAVSTWTWENVLWRHLRECSSKTSRQCWLVTPRCWWVFDAQRRSLPLANVHLFLVRTGSLRVGTSQHTHTAGPNWQPKIFQGATCNSTAKVFRNSFQVVEQERSMAVQPCPPCTSPSLAPSLPFSPVLSQYPGKINSSSHTRESYYH